MKILPKLVCALLLKTWILIHYIFEWQVNVLYTEAVENKLYLTPI